MIRRLIRVARFLTAPVARFRSWLDKQEIADDARRMNQAFPPNTRIVVTDGCKCGRHFVGRHGYVGDLSSFGGEEPDYRVFVDGNVWDAPEYSSLHGKPKYELICAKALERERTAT